MRRKIKYVLPHLCNGKGDLDSVWYVEYSFRDDVSGKLERFRVYDGFKKIKSVEERLQHAKTIIEEITSRIAQGWTPFDLDRVVCNNHIAYEVQTRIYGKSKESEKNLFYYINEFLNEKQPLLKRKTHQDNTSKFRVFYQWLESIGKGNIYAQDVTNDLIVDFCYYLINDRKLERRTIRDSKQRINQLFSWLMKKNIVTKNPVYDLPSGIQRYDHSAQPMTKDDARTLLDYIKKKDVQLYLFCAMIYYCAIRPGTELRFLKVKDINFFTNMIKIDIANGKTGEGFINMPPEVARILRSQKISTYNRDFYVFGKNQKPGPDCWGKNNFRQRFNKYRDELGFPKEYKLYSWKCTGAILFAMSGAPLPAIRDHCRHKSTAYTDIYLSKKIGRQNDYVKHKFPKL